MQIRYFDPLSRAFEGMMNRLFRPMDIKKWFVVGFTCWLARFVEINGGGGGSTGYTGDWETNSEATMLASTSSFAGAMEEIPWVGAIGAVGCLFLFAAIVALVLVMLWVGSRGQFMFLDNVVHDRALVKKPWARYRMQGNSLFLWKLCFAVAAVLVLGGVGMLAAVGLGLNSMDSVLAPDWSLVATCFVILLPLIVLVIYVDLFATHFVVPIMYAEELPALQAWKRFLPIFRARAGHFLLYGFFLLLLSIGVAAAVVVAGCLTLCLGFLVLIVPYLGTVVLLPVYMTKRLLSVEYLQQMMPELGLVREAS